MKSIYGKLAFFYGSVTGTFLILIVIWNCKENCFLFNLYKNHILFLKIILTTLVVLSQVLIIKRVLRDFLK